MTLNTESMVLGAVIFDFDGTLIDSYTQRWIAHREVCKFLSEYLDKRGFEPDRDVILDLISKTEIKKRDRKSTRLTPVTT